MFELKNPFIFAPIKTGYSDASGNVTQKHLDFYGQRAKYLGAVIPEPFYLDKSLREVPTQMGIDKYGKLVGLKTLVSLLHGTGTKAIAHLNHPGRMANPKIPGNRFISSTDKPCENGGSRPKRMENNDFSTVINLFVHAALRAEKANFDIIELQFGHGYLAAQFLSPSVNDRTDAYGGNFENRIRFPLQILQAVRKAIHIPIIIRISADEMTPLGFHLYEMKKFALLLQENLADAVHVSAGTVCSTPPWFFQHMFVPKGKTWQMAKEIKQAIDIPVIAVGQINEFSDIERLQREKMADLFAVGRALIADPDFIGKFLGEVKGIPRPCLACSDGCLGGVKSGKGLHCLVNPLVGEDIRPLIPSETSKKFAVVGGGLAGLETALDLDKRNHAVDLYEKAELGGQFLLASLTPKKKSMSKIIDYYIHIIENSHVRVIQKEGVASDLLDYDGVILTTGSIPKVPAIPGLNNYYGAEILLEKNIPSNKNILIIGGGLIGVDIATALIPRNNRITLVKRSVDFGEDMEAIAKTLSLKMLEEKGTVFSDHTYIYKVEGKTAYAKKNGKNIRFEHVDIFIVSTGLKPFAPLKDQLENKVPLYLVGDAKTVGKAGDAISSAFKIATKL